LHPFEGDSKCLSDLQCQPSLQGIPGRWIEVRRGSVEVVVCYARTDPVNEMYPNARRVRKYQEWQNSSLLGRNLNLAGGNSRYVEFRQSKGASEGEKKVLLQLQWQDSIV